MSAVCEHSAFRRLGRSNECKHTGVSVKKSVSIGTSESNSNGNVVQIEGKLKLKSERSQKSSSEVKPSREGPKNGVRSGPCTPEKDCPSTNSRDFHVMRRGITRYTRKHEAGKPSKIAPEGILVAVEDEAKPRCGWITSQTNSRCIAYHDQEWGVPVHDDRKLFELLVLVGAQADLTWPTILNRRDAFGATFANFDIATVAAFDEEKIMHLASNNEIAQHEGKIRGIVDNAKCMIEIVKQFGSFDKYMWGFVNHKQIATNYRFSRQIPVKTPKSEYISKDLMRRGFRFVGPTIVYSFMQAAGMTNGHLVHCFRQRECTLLAERHSSGGSNPRQNRKNEGDLSQPKAPIHSIKYKEDWLVPQA